MSNGTFQGLDAFLANPQPYEVVADLGVQDIPTPTFIGGGGSSGGSGLTPEQEQAIADNTAHRENELIHVERGDTLPDPSAKVFFELINQANPDHDGSYKSDGTNWVQL